MVETQHCMNHKLKINLNLIQGLQTGEAFIEMVGEKQAEYLQDNRDKKLILVNGNRHQVQVEKCSIDEMATLLHGIRDYSFVPTVPPSEASIEQQHCSQSKCF